MRVDDVKSETLNLRVSPSFKLALKAAADSDQRSMVNMLEVLVGDYCKAKRIEPPKPSRSARASNRSHLNVAA